MCCLFVLRVRFRNKLEGHSAERIVPPTKVFRRLIEQNHFKTSNHALAARYVAACRQGSKSRSLYDIGESNPVLASGLWSGSGSKVNQFVHVLTLLREILLRENPTYTYWCGPTLQRGVVLNWFYSLSRRNTFVGGTCAPPSALLVIIFVKFN